MIFIPSRTKPGKYWGEARKLVLPVGIATF